MENLSQPALGNALRSERRRRRLSLRDLSDEIGVSFNTLSRVERGHIPELANYQLILKWLGAPGQSLFEEPRSGTGTADLIARHLYTDERLTPENAKQIASLVQDLYAQLATPRPAFAVHLRSSQTFIPEVGTLLSDVLEDMHSALLLEAE